MNNVLEDSLFVSQNKKFDEIQSIIKDNIFAVIQNYARKKLRGSGFAVQSMMMNMGVDFLKAGYDFCVRKYGTSTQDHLDAMSTLSKMYEHAYDEYKSLYQVIYLTISRSRLCNITYLDEVVLSSILQSRERLIVK